MLALMMDDLLDIQREENASRKFEEIRNSEAIVTVEADVLHYQLSRGAKQLLEKEKGKAVQDTMANLLDPSEDGQPSKPEKVVSLFDKINTLKKNFKQEETIPSETKVEKDL